MNWTAVHTSIAVFFYLLALWNCLEILTEQRAPATSLGWILINLAFPFVGVPAFLLFGKYRMRGYIRRHRALTRTFDEQIAEMGSRYAPLTTPTPEGIASQVDLFSQILRNCGSMVIPHRNHVQLLQNGEETFEAIFSAIAKAKHYIFVQYYILRSDKLGLELKALLEKKCLEGVAVYLLYDDMGSFWLSRQYIRDLVKAGVKVSRFLPLTKVFQITQLNFRNHRKLVIVDGMHAFTGGLNVGDEYVGKNRSRIWRDTHIRVSGPAVRQLEEVFLEDWFFAADRAYNIKPLLNLVRSTGPADEPIQEPLSIVQVMPSGPADDVRYNVLAYAQMMQMAKQRIWITTPYLAPDPTLMRSLELAVLRGVDVRILLPKQAEHYVVHWVSISFAEELKTRGIKVYLYDAGFLHEKVLLIDESLVTVGTMNFDIRAFYLNFEMTIIIHDQAFAEKTRIMLEDDIAHSSPLEFPKGKYWRRALALRGNLARLASPLV